MATGENPFIGPLRQVAPAFLTYTAICVSFFLAPDPARLSFYEAAAQVIPVLALVLVIEMRLFQIKPADLPPTASALVKSAYQATRFAHRAQILGIAFVLVLGEISAFDVLASGQHDASASKLVAGAVYGGFIGVIVFAATGMRRPTDR